jgi:hypothetical protein
MKYVNGVEENAQKYNDLSAQKGQASGIATLDAGGRIPASQLTAGIVSGSGIAAQESIEISMLAADVVALYSARMKVVNLLSSINWGYTLATGSTSGTKATFTPTARLGQAKRDNIATTVIGHIYYFRVKVKAASNQVKCTINKHSSGDVVATLISNGSGVEEELHATFTATSADTVDLKVIDYRTSGWDEITADEAMFTDITAECGAGFEPSKMNYRAAIYKANSSNYFVASTLIPNLLPAFISGYPDSADFTRMYVELASNVINIITRYNDGYDMRYTLGKRGPNLLFDFLSLYKIANTTRIVSTEAAAGTAFLTNNTDTLSPYVVAAVNNINGDLPASQHYTGGNHGYNNDATGSATARCSSLVFFVDGKKVTSFIGYASRVEMAWTNYIQAYNTKVSAGTGREVMKESYRMSFDGSEWKIRCTIEFLEACTVTRYYGLEMATNAWDGYTLFQSSANKQWVAGNVNANSTDKNCNIITHKTGTDYTDLEIKPTGLGKTPLLGAMAYNAFRSNASKSYFYLIDYTGYSMALGDVLTWEGARRFYSD